MQLLPLILLNVLLCNDGIVRKHKSTLTKDGYLGLVSQTSSGKMIAVYRVPISLTSTYYR